MLTTNVLFITSARRHKLSRGIHFKKMYCSNVFFFLIFSMYLVDLAFNHRYKSAEGKYTKFAKKRLKEILFKLEIDAVPYH